MSGFFATAEKGSSVALETACLFLQSVTAWALDVEQRTYVGPRGPRHSLSHRILGQGVARSAFQELSRLTPDVSHMKQQRDM